ncbi:LemA family protein [Thalassoglobus neptunius]|uniref:LemA family protein n=1 Tax=Thalassoglobus neptunius TaxID=1938619 RepID=A0A5C5VBJ7_9PLAN|nr:LemA family protein [Thalassoglobus neptunius]TWT35082.1 LemA family protein [Thalassoglobus neptunius]
MKSILPVLIVLGLIVVGIGGCAVSGYNRVISLDEKVKSSWAQVETQLQRRYDLIPNLVETVKGVAAQEESIFVGVAEARSKYQNASTINEKAAAASGLESALGRLLAIREAYPELRSNESFLKLQDQLEGTENRVSVERGRYNEAVQSLNSYIRGIPGSLWASFVGVQKAEYFEVESDAAREVPKVDFRDSSKESASVETIPQDSVTQRTGPARFVRRVSLTS